MKIYQTTKIMNINAGHVLLNANQANSRKHLLVKLGDDDDIELTDAESELLGDEPRSVYRVLAPLRFKVGEIIGYDGEINRALAAELMPAEQVLEEIAEETEEEVDSALVDAINMLDPDNTAHFNFHTGKPELAVLKQLLDRTVTGKERDAAWLYIQDAKEASTD